ncbi:MAG TPA: hypothetical protein VN634_01860 [Candidatus Limnocylindrales bacterium]|nr:hypothetical protein [Candidatus Limnocylindrales bacterium]
MTKGTFRVWASIAVALGVVALPGDSSAYTAGRDSKVLLLHGRQCHANYTSNDKNHMQTDWWRNADSTLESLGWSGSGISVIKMGYYSDTYTVNGASNYDVWALKHWKGSASGNTSNHNLHFDRTGCHVKWSGDADWSHTGKCDIRHLAYHVAWAIYNKYTSNGESVDVVAHSMGGLVIRYALQQVQAGHADFPPSLMIEDVVTVSTPHGGINPTLNGWDCDDFQTSQMAVGSTFLTSLSSHPAGTGGTDWTAIGGFEIKCHGLTGDIVSPESSTWNGADHKAVYANPGYGHEEYFNAGKGVGPADTDVFRQDGNGSGTAFKYGCCGSCLLPGCGDFGTRCTNSNGAYSGASNQLRSLGRIDNALRMNTW